MSIQRYIYAAIAMLALSSGAFAQRAEISVSFTEQFFDVLMDAMYQNAGPPEFSLSSTEGPGGGNRPAGDRLRGSFAETSACNETIRLQREMNGVKTAVRFRDGKIVAPIAFTGNYNPPLIGCVAFGGVAESVVDLEFDQASQRLMARARVTNVSLNGTGGVGGSLIARMVQSSIDRKVNPIEIISLDKVSFLVPVHNSSTLKMKAAGIRHEVKNGVLIVHVTYEFIKG